MGLQFVNWTRYDDAAARELFSTKLPRYLLHYLRLFCTMPRFLNSRGLNIFANDTNSLRGKTIYPTHCARQTNNLIEPGCHGYAPNPRMAGKLEH